MGFLYYARDHTGPWTLPEIRARTDNRLVVFLQRSKEPINGGIDIHEVLFFLKVQVCNSLKREREKEFGSQSIISIRYARNKSQMYQHLNYKKDSLLQFRRRLRAEKKVRCH